MKTVTFGQAMLEAMQEEMLRDPTVFVMGEDIARQGGVFGQFKGLGDVVGHDRVIDTPITETAIVGAGVGAAMAGMRPVVDMHFADFFGVCMDEVFNQMAKVRYMFGGQTKVPLVVRAPDGLGRGSAAQHSQSVEAWFTHIPGVQVVIPSNPADAKGLLKTAIRNDNPVIFFENKMLFSTTGEIPEDEHLVPFGQARVARGGTDVSIISYGATLLKCLEAAESLAGEDIQAEVLDLRSLSPLDKDSIIATVAKTGRVVIAHEAVKQSGFGAEIAAVIAEEAIGYLDGPILRVAAPFTPVPFSPSLEDKYRIFPDQIAEAAKKLL